MLLSCLSLAWGSMPLHEPPALQADLDELVGLVQEVHPDPFTVTPREDFLAAVEEVRAQLTEPMDAVAFWRLAAPLYTMLGDGHTGLSLWHVEGIKEIWDSRTPVSLKASSGGFSFRGAPSWAGEAPEPGTPLVSLNGTPAAELRAELEAYLSGELVSFRNSKLDDDFAFYHRAVYGPAESDDFVFEGGELWSVPRKRPESHDAAAVERSAPGFLGISFRLSGALVAEYVHPDSPSAKAGVQHGDLLLEISGQPVDSLTEVSERMRDFPTGEALQLTVERSGQPLTLSLTAGAPIGGQPFQSVALTDLIQLVEGRSFEDPRAFERVLKRMFRSMRRRGAEALIVDVRFNGGGNSTLIDVLGRHITAEPFKQYGRIDIRVSEPLLEQYRALGYESSAAALEQEQVDGMIVSEVKAHPHQRSRPAFEGPVVFLASGHTFSSAADLITVAKDYEWGAILGEETGGVANSYGDLFLRELSHTGVEAFISHKYFLRPSLKESRRGTMPDLYVAHEDALLGAVEWLERRLDGAALPEAAELDALWDYRDPAGSEQRFLEFQLRQNPLVDRDLSVQTLTQMARAQGMQGRTEEAENTLLAAEQNQGDARSPAAVRIQLERGRLYRSAGAWTQAQPHFEQAFSLAQELQLPRLAADAGHMMAMDPELDSALHWTQQTLEITKQSEDPEVTRWAGPLHNNLGWAYYDAGRYSEALPWLEGSLEHQSSSGGALRARWAVARTLRALERPEEALTQLREQEEAATAEEGVPGGLVLWEIAECLWVMGEHEQAQSYLESARPRLQEDTWLADWDSEGWARLQRETSEASGH